MVTASFSVSTLFTIYLISKNKYTKFKNMSTKNLNIMKRQKKLFSGKFISHNVL